MLPQNRGSRIRVMPRMWSAIRTPFVNAVTSVSACTSKRKDNVDDRTCTRLAAHAVPPLSPRNQPQEPIPMVYDTG